MPAANPLRSLLPLVVGLVVGGFGAALFRDSLPGAEGSPEERATRLEAELKRANQRITMLEATGGRGVERTTREGLGDIARALRDGRPVTPDDILRATQPLLRDLAPLLDRIRVRQQREFIDSLTGEFSRKYDLTPAQQESLREWFKAKSEDEAQRWTELVTREGTTLEDLMRAAQETRPDTGLDPFMEQMLSGDKREAFRSERLAERAQRVQWEADRKLARMDAIVGLDDAQRDRMFGIIASDSVDYDPAMRFEGAAGDIDPAAGGDMLSVLRPEQLEAFAAERERRRQEAAADLEAIGLSLPPDWDPLEWEGLD